jgi:hypothetical protein
MKLTACGALGILIIVTAGCDAGSAGFGVQAEGEAERSSSDNQSSKQSSNENSAAEGQKKEERPTSSPIAEPTDITGAYLACYGLAANSNITYHCALLDAKDRRDLLPRVLEVSQPEIFDNSGSNLAIQSFSAVRSSVNAPDFKVTVDRPLATKVRSITAHYKFDGQPSKNFSASKDTLLPIKMGYIFISSGSVSGIQAQQGIGDKLCKQEGIKAGLPGNDFEVLMPRGIDPIIHSTLQQADWYSTSMENSQILLRGSDARQAFAQNSLPVLFTKLTSHADGSYADQFTNYWTFVQDPEGMDSCDSPEVQATVGTRFSTIDWLVAKVQTSGGKEAVDRRSCHKSMNVLCISKTMTTPPASWKAVISP